MFHLNQLFRRSRRNLIFGGLVLCSSGFSAIASADCAGLLLCTTYDFNLPVTITSTSALPALTVMGGNVGIGTTSPTNALSVAGTIQSTSGGFVFPDGSIQTTAGASSSSVTQVFTTSGPWIKPSSGHAVLVEAWGGGGGGATARSNSCTGGSGGTYTQSTFLFNELPSSVNVITGSGGAGQTSGIGSGQPGNTSYFGAYLSAPGGKGGLPSAAITFGSTGGTEAGGASSSYTSGASTVRSGGGGGALSSGTIRNPGSSSLSAGNGGAAATSGSGSNGLSPSGGGGCSVGNGGAGGAGQVRVTVY